MIMFWVKVVNFLSLFAILWWGLSLEGIRSPLFSTTGMQSYFSYSQPTLLSLWQLRSLEISEKLKELEAGANERLHFLYQKVCMRLKPISFSNFVYYSKRTQNRFENCFLAKKKKKTNFSRSLSLKKQFIRWIFTGSKEFWTMCRISMVADWKGNFRHTLFFFLIDICLEKKPQFFGS